MRLRALRLAVLLPGIFFGPALGAQTSPSVAALYVHHVVVAAQGDVSLGAIVQASGPASAEQKEAMSRSLTVLGESVQYLPTSLYMPQLEAAFGQDAIIVGARTVLIPKGTSAEGETYLLDRLVDFLAAQGLVDDGRVDISFTQSGLRGGAPQDGTPAFQVVKTSHAVEISFLLTDSAGNSVSGRATLAAAPERTDLSQGVKASSLVRVVFRKGPISVEVPGKALSSAPVGENVSVYVAESQRTFTGRVMDGKAVQVDLP
ncbi:MAG: flagella basal body P-ring formation protein FlgA [Spirochaetia bacterium]